MDVHKTRNLKMLVDPLKVLVVDDVYYSRKVVRTLLTAIGITKVFEAKDGASGLEAIQVHHPDIVLLDWEMPGMNGADFMRRVRSPETFMCPAVPVIMVTGHGEKSRVMEAVNLGVHEFLLKPVSSTALLTRIVGVVTVPRPMIRRGNYYGPEPRPFSTYKPDLDQGTAPAAADPNANHSPSAAPNYVIFAN
jgi:two-component system, chemotaxis family, chemotaxis protein CheY